MAFRNPKGINAPAYVSGESASVAWTGPPAPFLGSLTIPAPSGLEVGNLLVAYIGWVALVGSGVSSPGWTISILGAGPARFALCYKVVAAGEPASYTFSLATLHTTCMVGVIGNYEVTGVPAYADQSRLSPPAGPIPGVANPLRDALAVFGIGLFDANTGAANPIIAWPAGVNKRIEVDRWTGLIGAGLTGAHVYISLYEQKLTGAFPAQSFIETNPGVTGIKRRFTPGQGTPLLANFQGGFDPRRGKFRRRPR